MARKLEEIPKLDISMPAPPVRKLIPLTDEQVTILMQAQAVVTDAQTRLNALILGIMAGHHLVEGRVIRITDSMPRNLEIEISANGNGANNE